MNKFRKLNKKKLDLIKWVAIMCLSHLQRKKMNTNIVATVKATVKGATFVTASTETSPKLKKGCPVEVVKRQRLNGVIGFDYEACVNRLASKEGKASREAKPRAWGEVSTDKLFVEHKGKHYLRMKVEKALDIEYVNVATGEKVDVETLKPYLYANKSKSSTQKDLEGEVIERDVAVENIKELKFKGMTVS